MIFMRILVSLALIIGASVSGLSQTKSVNLELLGSSGMAGVNFDSRFCGNSGFGYSVGIGYGYSNGGFDMALAHTQALTSMKRNQSRSSSIPSLGMSHTAIRSRPGSHSRWVSNQI